MPFARTPHPSPTLCDPLTQFIVNVPLFFSPENGGHKNSHTQLGNYENWLVADLPPIHGMGGHWCAGSVTVESSAAKLIL